MTARRLLYTGPAVGALPSLDPPLVQRACFLMDGQNPNLAPVDFFSGQRATLNGTSCTSVYDGATGGPVFSMADTASYFETPHTQQLISPSTAYTVATRVNIATLNTSSNPIVGIGVAFNYQAAIEVGSSTQIFGSNAIRAQSTASINMTMNQWVWTVLRWQLNGLLRLTVWNDMGAILTDTSVAGGSGVAAWGSGAVVFWGSNGGRYDFILASPAYESDDSIRAAILRRRAMLAPWHGTPFGAIAQVFAQTVSGVADGSATIAHGRLGMLSASATASASLTHQKTALLAAPVRTVAALLHPALTTTLRSAKGNAAASLSGRTASKVLASSAHYAGSFGAFIILHVASATVDMIATAVRALAKAPAAAATGLPALARSQASHLAAGIQGVSGALLRLIRTADVTHAQGIPALGRGKAAILTGTAATAAALARALAASRAAAAEGQARLAPTLTAAAAAVAHGIAAAGRTVGRILAPAAGQGLAALLGRSARTLAAAAAGRAAALARAVGAGRAAAVAMTPSLAPARLFHVEQSVNVSTALQFMRTVFKPLAVAAQAIAGLFTGITYPPRREISVAAEVMTTSTLTGETLDG